MSWTGSVNPKVEGCQEASDCLLPMGAPLAVRAACMRACVRACSREYGKDMTIADGMSWKGSVNPKVEGCQEASDCLLPMGALLTMCAASKPACSWTRVVKTCTADRLS